MMTMVSQFCIVQPMRTLGCLFFTCSGPSGLAFEEKKRSNVFFDAVKDTLLV